MRNSFQPDPRDRVKSAAAAALINVALGAAFLTGLAMQPEQRIVDGLETFNVEPPDPPPPLVPERAPIAKEAHAPAGPTTDPSPIVAPPARLPSPRLIAAAPVAGTGSSTNAGAAASGSGTGAGGSGTGDGGGGGIGTAARLLGGNRARLPRALLRPMADERGYAHLFLTIDERGLVANCAVIQGTGSAGVDDALCQVMIRQSRWLAARDTMGRPISVGVRYTATWSKD